jgi:hypothetical protein
MCAAIPPTPLISGAGRRSVSPRLGDPEWTTAPPGKSCSDDPAFVIRSFFDVIESSRRRPNSWPRRVLRSRSNRPATGHPEQSGLHFGRPPIRSAMLFESSWEAHVSLFSSLRSSLTSPTGERLVRSGHDGRPDSRRLPAWGPEPFASSDSMSRRSTGTLATESRVRGRRETPACAGGSAGGAAQSRRAACGYGTSLRSRERQQRPARWLDFRACSSTGQWDEGVVVGAP